METLGRLSELLREALSGERPQEIPLTRELNLVEDYLELQRIRLAGQFSIGYDIADDVFEALVPSLMLPVLVEHAVVHGAPHPTTARHIKILALKAEPTVLRLEVVDTVAWLGTPGERDQKDIRLQSTRERLQQLYGAAHAIDVGRTAEGGARVVITLPFRQD